MIYNEKELRIKSEPITKTDDISSIISDLGKAMFDYEGEGLAIAGPQIGINKRVFIDKDQNIYINPIVVDKSRPFTFANEGCLSFPNINVNTRRYRDVTITYQDSHLNEHTITESGSIKSIVFQHEIDHLDGILMFDRKTDGTITVEKTGRNEPCPCGSGKKYKKCCNKILKENQCNN